VLQDEDAGWQWVWTDVFEWAVEAKGGSDVYGNRRRKWGGDAKHATFHVELTVVGSRSDEIDPSRYSRDIWAGARRGVVDR
jgi:hypothetical protein